VQDVAVTAEAWLREHALPLWSGAGFYSDQGLFAEQLSFSLQPIVEMPTRLTVQARQIFVYGLAARRGWLKGGMSIVEQAYAAMRRDYLRRSEGGGWAFAAFRDGGLADGTRDFYAHAFALLGIASYSQATGDRLALVLAEETLSFLDSTMASPAGGYIETLSGAAGFRRQNPHMHLFEALLALWEASGELGFLKRADRVFELFASRLFQAKDSVLPEYFDDNLKRAPGPDGLIVEPGHHFEWVWLLRRYQRARPAAEVDGMIDALYQHADTLGFDDVGLVMDEVLADGTPRKRTHRLWPMTEAIRCYCVESRHQRPQASAKAVAVAEKLWSSFLERVPPGTWMDRLDDQGHPASDTIPASSLYHLVGMIEELLETAADAKVEG
jgi:mannose-6-phosphate isomerase